MAILFGLAALVVGGRPALELYRSWARRRRAGRGEARPEDATIVYMNLLKLMAARGFPKAPSQTAEEYVADLSDPFRGPVKMFTTLYLSSRWGGNSTSLGQMDTLFKEISMIHGH